MKKILLFLVVLIFALLIYGQQNISKPSKSDFEKIDLKEEDSFDVSNMALEQGIKYSDMLSVYYNPSYAQKLFELNLLSIVDFTRNDIEYCKHDVSNIIKYTAKYNKNMVTLYNPKIFKKVEKSIQTYCSMTLKNMYQEI